MTFKLREHHVQWVTAGPLWRSAVGTSRDDATPSEAALMRRPALLRFERDTFMDELLQLMASDPPALKGYEATLSTRVGYRVRPPDAPASWSSQPDHLKLYQPVHGHFNLVAASLVCRRAGLPDHAVNRGAHESVGFVMRRLSGSSELAWTGTTWMATATSSERKLVTDEQVTPLFPMAFVDAEGRRRTLFCGSIPTASTETFDAGAPGAAPGLARAPDETDPTKIPDQRLIELQQKVIDPLAQILQTDPQTTPDPDARTDLVAAREDATRFLLLDLVEFLRTYLPNSWEAISSRASFGTILQGTLQRNDIAPGWPWAEALRQADVNAAAILAQGGTKPKITMPIWNAAQARSEAKKVAGWFANALKTTEGATTKPPVPSPSAPGPESAQLPKLDPSGATRYVLRCVYRRPDCTPLHDDVVSDPSEPFAIAPFFDPDAPARPVQIALPGDPKDLRSFNKNVRLLLSQQMQQSISRASDLSALMKGSVGQPGQVNLGLVCSFSIPIITICALILLMIIVNLLNIVFWWMPFFRICFPSVKE